MGGLTKQALEESWPKAWAGVCGHCCHAFDGPPRPLPIGFCDPMRKTYRTHSAKFCSWPCALGYYVYTMKCYPPGSETSMRELAGDVKPAPPREALSAFGGVLTLRDFRRHHATHIWEVLPPKLILPDDFQHTNYAVSAPRAKKTQKLTFDNVPRNETIRLKKPKKLLL